MAYPRSCPLCGADCGGSTRRTAGSVSGSAFRHAMLSAEPGGTPSPWRPGLPGRLLTLRCLACRGEYVWDYFAGRPAAGAMPAPRRLERAARARRWPLALPGER